MLTSDLILSTYRKGKVYPLFLKPEADLINNLEEFIAYLESCKKMPKGEIEENCRSFFSNFFKPKTLNSFLKLYLDRCEFDNLGTLDPLEFRNTVFNLGAEYWKSVPAIQENFLEHQKALIQKLPSNINIGSSEMRNILFSDNQANQCLIKIPKLKAEDLLKRFNISQVQGILWNAQHTIIKITNFSKHRFRQLMQYLKYFGLMFEVIEYSKKELQIELGGPSSILENSRSYGFELSNFFSAFLLIQGDWEWSTVIYDKKREREYSLLLNEKNKYESYYKVRGQWISEKVEELVKKIKNKAKKTFNVETCSEVFSIENNQYLIPDFKIQTEEESYYFEWIRYPSLKALEKIESNDQRIPKNYFWLIKQSKMYATISTDTLERVIFYKTDPTLTSINNKLKMERGISLI